MLGLLMSNESAISPAAEIALPQQGEDAAPRRVLQGFEDEVHQTRRYLYRSSKYRTSQRFVFSLKCGQPLSTRCLALHRRGAVEIASGQRCQRAQVTAAETRTRPSSCPSRASDRRRSLNRASRRSLRSIRSFPSRQAAPLLRQGFLCRKDFASARRRRAARHPACGFATTKASSV